ncbi:DUF433 domain-containing protein [Lamprocystis purpurea]|uniref:DUF433 domain-containing protein n=1 Tax=Lamprocystis purpurea TaxID=61598 RepID=UPI00038204C7|nr:DUF433 domain-containing protein [Lamprocystis purpurea]
MRPTRPLGKPSLDGFLSAGESQDEILRQYPSLEPADIDACLRFAAELMAHRYTLQRVA